MHAVRRWLVSTVMHALRFRILMIATRPLGIALAAMAAGLSVAACLGSMPPPPPLLAVPGVKASAKDVHKDTVTSLAGSPIASRIMQISASEGGRLLIVAEAGLRWIDATGQLTREVAFDERLFRHALLTMPDGRIGVGGFGSRGRSAVVLDLNGQEVLRIKGTWYQTRVPKFANVIAGPDAELLLHDKLDVRIFDLNGVQLGTVSSPQYATIKTVIQADDDDEYEIAFVKTSLSPGPIETLIMNADGSTVSQWKDAEGGWLSFVPELDDTRLWGITPEGFTAWNAQGQRMEVFPAPDANYLRYVIGAKLEKHTVLIASGGGYSNLGLLCVFDDARRLVYQEVFPFRIYAVLAGAGGSDFYVGAGYDVVRYSIAAEEGR